MARVKKEELERLVKFINKTEGRPTNRYLSDERGEWIRGGNNRLTPMAGHLSLDHAYGGYKLVEMSSNGGEREITRLRMTAKELHIYLTGRADALDYMEKKTNQ